MKKLYVLNYVEYDSPRRPRVVTEGVYADPNDAQRAMRVAMESYGDSRGQFYEDENGRAIWATDSEEEDGREWSINEVWSNN